MNNFSNLYKATISLFFVIFSGASIFYQTTCYGAKNPDFLRYYTPLDKKLGENMTRYIGTKHSANWVYKGALYKQFGDVFSMVPDHQTNLIGRNLYITSGYRYQDATNRGAMIVSDTAHIYLAAIAQAATYSHGELQGPPPQLRVLVRDPKNLRYLPDIEQWAQTQPDMRGYVLTLYNLNCKTRDIAQCKMASTAKQETQVWPSPGEHVNWAAMQRFWERSMKLPGIDTGPANSPKHMLVYFDPNCPVCAQQWEQLIPYLDSVRIHWIPIAYFDKDSLSRAAALLAAAHPAQALMQNERGYNQKSHEGGYSIPLHIPSWALRVVQSNTRDAERILGQIATPTLGFELEPDKKYYRFTGFMDAASIRTAVQALGHRPNFSPKQR